MLFFFKLKQKIAKIKSSKNKKTILAVSLLAFAIIFLLPRPANAWGEFVIVWLLQIILKAVVLILDLAEMLFEFIINANNMRFIMDNKIIYTTWGTVRDIFNITFILVLIFSAFSTIFQASANFNYKKVSGNLIIMALLVNFSFPISRFIIDASNMLIYGLFNQMAGQKSLVSIIEITGISSLKNPASTDIVFLICAIVFVFILAFTLLIFAGLLIIRTIALTILVIFSPIAFVGTILPGSKLSAAANDWWRDFLKYCFSGAILIFFLVIADSLAREILVHSTNEFTEIAIKNSGGSKALEGFLVKASFFSLPIIILWYGIIESQKSGTAGASMIVGYAKKAMRWTSQRPKKIANWGFQKTGIPGGVKQKYAQFKKTGYFGTDAVAEREARIAGGFGIYKVPGAIDKVDKKRIDEAKDQFDMENIGADKLKSITLAGDKFARAAAIQELINRDLFDMSNGDNKKAYQAMQGEFKETSQTFRQINNKIKVFDPVSAFAHIKDKNERESRMKEHVNSNKFDAKKLGRNSLQNEDFLKLAFDEDAISNSELEDLRKKSNGHESDIKRTLKAIAGEAKYTDLSDLDKKIKAEKALPVNQQNENNIKEWEKQLRIAKKVQVAHFAQTGDFHSSISDKSDSAQLASVEMLIQGMDKDTLKRTSEESAKKYASQFAGNIDNNKIKSSLQAMGEGSAAEIAQATTRINTYHPTREAKKYNTFERNKAKISNDRDLQQLV